MNNFSKYFFIAFIGLVSVAGCTKEPVTNNNSNKTDTTATGNGKAIIFLKQDCNVGNVTVTINNVTRLIKNYATEFPDCGADSDYAVFSLPPGTYKVNGAGGNQQWNGSVTVTSGQCTGLQFTCDGVTPVLKGAAGYPRFNLQQSPGVDLDLHVVTPDGTEISSYNLSGQGGTLDVESSCLGSDTNILYGLSATNENVWFPAGYAPHGTYKFWVQFSGTCTNLLSGSYTLRVVNGLSTVKTYSGTITITDVNKPLNTYNSPVYTLTY